MRAALLAQISEVALPEGDSDDEEGAGEGRESSDDGSDSDTVENVVLPSRCHSLLCNTTGLCCNITHTRRLACRRMS